MFQPITLKWNGEDFTVPAKNIMGLIAAIENHITIVQLSNPMVVKNTQLAKAYAAALNYAGAEATPEEVYIKLFSSDDEENVKSILGYLMLICVPPDSVQAVVSTKKPKAAAPAKKKRKASSRGRTK